MASTMPTVKCVRALCLAGALAICPAAFANMLLAVSDTQMHAINFDTLTDTVLFTLPGTGDTANGLALDTTHNMAFYRQSDIGTFAAWNATTNANVNVNLNGFTLPGRGTNAAFYNSSYWYIEDASNTLVRVVMNLTNPSSPSVSVVTASTIMGAPAMHFNGDLAVSNNGIMYGDSAQGFFSIDISGGAAGTFTMINAATTHLQLGWGPNKAFFYGTNNATQTWYTINPATGATAQIYNGATPFTTSDFNDLSDEQYVPEPGTSALCLIPAAAIGLRRRSRRR